MKVSLSSYITVTLAKDTLSRIVRTNTISLIIHPRYVLK